MELDSSEVAPSRHVRDERLGRRASRGHDGAGRHGASIRLDAESVSDMLDGLDVDGTPDGQVVAVLVGSEIVENVVAVRVRLRRGLACGEVTRQEVARE